MKMKVKNLKESRKERTEVRDWMVRNKDEER